MPVNIKSINVGDGDAHVITLTKGNLTKVVLIDGGDKDSAITEKVLTVLKETLDKYKKDGPDLIVCTHYDRDHIWGLIQIAEKYKGKIGECWMHMPSEGYAQKITILKETLSHIESVGEGMNWETMAPSYKIKNNPLIAEQVNFLIESFDDMKALKAALGKTKITEPFVETNTCLADFPEFKVVAPSEAFYKQYLPKEKTEIVPSDLLDALTINPDTEIITEELKAKTSCEQLPVTSKGAVTPVNLVSIIVEYTEDNKKYLFTGDAGIESFTHQSDYKALFADLHFMTVPHHGSRHNISTELIEIFKAKTAFVSAAGKEESGSIKRPHAAVLGCYHDKSTKVYKTQDVADYLEFDHNGAVSYDGGKKFS